MARSKQDILAKIAEAKKQKRKMKHNNPVHDASAKRARLERAIDSSQKESREKKQEDLGREKALAELVTKAPPEKFRFSDGTVVSLKQAKHWFLKKIESQPDKEKRIAEIHYKKYRTYLGKKGGLQRLGNKKKLIQLARYETEIIELYGKMFTPEDVREILFDIYQMKVPVEILEKVRYKNIELVAQKIEHHQNSHSELRLSHKRSRIEEYTELYQKLKVQYLQTPTPPILNSLITCLRAIKDEVEGDLVINGAININLEHQIAAHFKSEVYKSANIQELIIAKVATRMNINPLMLMWSIENSYYHDMNQKNVEDIDWEEEKFPSDETYDYEHMEEQYEKRKKEREAASKNVVKNTEVTPEMAEEFKRKLLENLNGTKKVVKSKKDIMDAIRSAKQG